MWPCNDTINVVCPEHTKPAHGSFPFLIVDYIMFSGNDRSGNNSIVVITV